MSAAVKSSINRPERTSTGSSNSARRSQAGPPGGSEDADGRHCCDLTTPDLLCVAGLGSEAQMMGFGEDRASTVVSQEAVTFECQDLPATGGTTAVGLPALSVVWISIQPHIFIQS